MVEAKQWLIGGGVINVAGLHQPTLPRSSCDVDTLPCHQPMTLSQPIWLPGGHQGHMTCLSDSATKVVYRHWPLATLSIHTHCLIKDALCASLYSFNMQKHWHKGHRLKYAPLQHIHLQAQQSWSGHTLSGHNGVKKQQHMAVKEWWNIILYYNKWQIKWMLSNLYVICHWGKDYNHVVRSNLPIMVSWSDHWHIAPM